MPRRLRAWIRYEMDDDPEVEGLMETLATQIATVEAGRERRR